MTALPHVLFVDDEAQVLSGLRRMLRDRRSDWDMSFAVGAKEALDILASRPCDVIVSDYRMPGMDGGALLEIVRERYPEMARIILSGHTDEADLLKVIVVVHQFLNKPCDEAEIVAAIERVLSLRPTLGNDAIRRAIAGIESLPSPPATLHALFDALDSPDASGEAVARVLDGDVAAAAKVLQVVNSSSFGMSHKVSDVSQAVALLGLQNVRALILVHDLVHEIDPRGVMSANWVAAFAQRSVRTARLAGHLSAGRPWRAEAAAAGLLHDIGLLVIASCRPEAFASHQQTWATGDRPLADVERDTFGVDHAAIGAYLLGLWGVPSAVIDAVAAHTTAAPSGSPDDVGSVIALASHVVEARFGPACGPPAGGAALPTLAPGVATAVDRWQRETAREDKS
jgi:HD-like signal output (HDOD) protein/CheY-like chemotaxis protein